ncbi:MAG: type I-E CRISPR-associated protein Cas6/Cse3/CasE [Candidatus Thiodiazotropha sp. (ex Epidulcina cf. delphinae)]|nr:type I-E CRISPR-associated protein Cas6/Cse3/CasE [Candidatus Thiodiazotropha sp. (ex Epidulcina cf. delphinae)]
MTTPLTMLELRLDAKALIRFAQDQKPNVNRNRDEDLGYATHAWLKALFQERSPKPFRLILGNNPKLLGYSPDSGRMLLEQAQTFANPLALGVTRIDDLRHAKIMPREWRPGRRLGFEVMTCPTSRKAGHEKDLYRHRMERREEGEEAPPRESVYRAWLEKQLGDAARLETAKLEKFRFVSQYRRGMKPKKLDRPQALIKGVLTIADSDAFNRLLARGVGRHRAFGFGMLLLRPA